MEPIRIVEEEKTKGQRPRLKPMGGQKGMVEGKKWKEGGGGRVPIVSYEAAFADQIPV